MKTFLACGVLTIATLTLACYRAESARSAEPIPQTISAGETPKLDAETLCQRLQEIKHIPYHSSLPSEDPIYLGLMEAGEKAIPCLVEKITDTKVIDDPNDASQVIGFTVGDAATFMLLYITNEDWQPGSMFPQVVAKQWKSEGVYAYYAYVEKPKNRRAFQQWWKMWMKKSRK